MGLVLVSGEQGVGEATEAVALSLPPLLPTLSRGQHLRSAQLCYPLRPPQHLEDSGAWVGFRRAHMSGA